MKRKKKNSNRKRKVVIVRVDRMRENRSNVTKREKSANMKNELFSCRGFKNKKLEKIKSLGEKEIDLRTDL